MQLVDDWLDRKLQSYRLLDHPATVTHEWKRMTGRVLRAGLTLSARPAEAFSFTSAVEWPVPEVSRYEQMVVDGVLDALIAPAGWAEPVLGAAFVLEEIQWDAEGSVALAFYMAAREAAQIIIEGKIGRRASV